MTIKKRLSMICLVFSIIPLLVVYWLGKNAGLAGNGAFEHAIALGVMFSILIGLFSSGAVRHWFLGKQLERIKEFCIAVKDGSYNVFLPVPNESSDIDDENEMVELMRNMNWMAHHIKLNEESLQSQKDELEKSYAKQLIVQRQLESRTKQLTEALYKVRNLLDHAGQGFVSFDQELVVSDEYSAECSVIFNKEIAGEKIINLLYPEDPKQAEFITTVLKKIFTVEDDFLRENYFTLLPGEIVIEGAYIKIDYKFIYHCSKSSRKEIMLILTDVTKERKMEEEIQEEKDTLSMVVKVVTQYDDFFESIQGYTAFCHRELSGILAFDCPAPEKLSTVFCMIHTWKGIFAQLNMQHTVAELHAFEAVLADLREKKAVLADDLMGVFHFYTGEKLSGWLANDMNLLKSILGEKFLAQYTMVNIEKARLDCLKEKIAKWPVSPQKREIFLELETLTYRPFKELLQAYPEYTLHLAQRYEKTVQPFVVRGGEFLVNPEIYRTVTQSLVHIFRNAVAHGLERPEERLEAEKEEAGAISCDVENTPEMILLTIKDDGCGVDGECIKRLAVEKGIVSRKTALALSEEEAVDLIFADGFSGAAYADEISGRGVGLYAVRKEVEKLGGRIKVRSRKGRGTEFNLMLPFVNQAG